jgi:uncharacterized membrane protein YkoI
MTAILLLVAIGFIAFTISDYRQLKEQSAERAAAMERIRQQALREFPGRIVNSRIETGRNRTVYRVQIADDKGRRTWLTYDVETGERLSPEH